MMAQCLIIQVTIEQHGNSCVFMCVYIYIYISILYIYICVCVCICTNVIQNELPGLGAGPQKRFRNEGFGFSV